MCSIQLTLEQHGLELHGSTYMQIFFSINIQKYTYRTSCARLEVDSLSLRKHEVSDI